MNQTIYEGIYKLLRDYGHYEKALSCTFNENNVLSKFVQNLTIGYLADWDDFTDESNSLLRKMFNSDKIEYITELVNFMWTFKNRDIETNRTKIKPLWKAVIEKINPEIEKSENQNISKNLGKWLALVDTIDDDIYDWLKISMKAGEEDSYSGHYVEYFLIHVNKTPNKVGNLFLELLNAGHFPILHQNDIVTIVRSLYNLNEKDIANRICNLYLLKGYTILRDIFDEYNKE